MSSSATTWNPSLGTRVKLQGLQGRVDLNGRIGRVIKRLDKKTGRVGVQVLVLNLLTNHPESVQIKPINLLEAPAVESPETYLDGFDVVDSGDDTLGRISVASKEYQPGDIVLIEAPTYVFDPRTGYIGMFDAYLKSSHSNRDQILDMFCPPMIEGNNDTLKEKAAQTQQQLQLLEMHWNTYALRFPGVKKDLPIETAKKLLQIINANAHSFTYEHTGEMVATNSKPHEDMMALFARGSKVEHSCAPNLTYTTNQGNLIYRATRHIAKGDRVSISYQTAWLEYPRNQRQQFLQMNKQFFCQCLRCMGPDECNPYFASCPTCNNSKSVVFSYGNQSKYQCITCQDSIEPSSLHPQQALEEAFQERMDYLENYVQSGQAIYEGPNWLSKMVALQNEMMKKLHPLHWLHVKGDRAMGSCAASFALLHMNDGRNRHLLKSLPYLYCSTMAQLHHAYWLQQANAIVYHDFNRLEEVVTNMSSSLVFTESPSIKDIECFMEKLREGQELTDASSPYIEMVHPIFHAGQDLLLTGHTLQVAQLYEMFLPLFQQWDRLSQESRDRIALLVHSNGADNQFPNHLLRD